MGIKIGGIVTSLYQNGREMHFVGDGSYRQFTSSGKSDIRVRLHGRPLPQLKKSQRLMRVNNVWDLYKIDQGYAFVLPYQKLLVSPDFHSADFYRSFNPDDISYPLSYPFDQLLMIGLLAKGRGVVAHACGISYKGKGVLFMGHSGAGKSTLARLLNKQKDIMILSDDRIIIRKKNRGYFMYGTPWQGEAEFSSATHVPLDKIFFLCQANKNRIMPVPISQAAARMFSHSFFAFWDTEGVSFSVDFYSRLIQEIPAYELKFRADASIVDFIQSHTL